MKVMLVEDDTEFAQKCVEALLGMNHQVSFVRDGVSARRRIVDDDYDIIIIDLMLPPSFGVEGLDLLKYLKMHDRQIPTIMITSRAFKTTNIVSEAMKLGAADFIDKDEPLFMERLSVAVKEIDSPSNPPQPRWSSRPLVGYIIAFVIVGSFCLLLIYLLRDFKISNILVLSGFLFLCLLVLVFLVASGLLENGKIDKHLWYRLVSDKVLVGPLNIFKTLLRGSKQNLDASSDPNIDGDK